MHILYMFMSCFVMIFVSLFALVYSLLISLLRIGKSDSFKITIITFKMFIYSLTFDFFRLEETITKLETELKQNKK